MHRGLLAILFCVSTLLWPALAQEVSAGLTGRVTDSSGGAVIGAAVAARDEERGTTWMATTNEDGIYAFPRIPNGSYTLKVEAAGFVRSVHSNVTLEINQRGRVDIVLQLGAVIGAGILDDSPLISRNVIELSLLIPGVTATDPSTFNTGTRADSSGGRPFVNGN